MGKADQRQEETSLTSNRSRVSKLETRMTRWSWQRVGGTLVEEFCAVRRGEDCSNRLIDGVIVKGEEFRIARQPEVDVSGKDIFVV